MQGPKSRDECPQKRAAGELGDTEGSVTTGRDCMMSYRPRTTGERSNSQKPGEGYRAAAPSRRPEGTSPADTLNLYFQPPELWESPWLLFPATRSVALAFSSPEKLLQGPSPLQVRARRGRGPGKLLATLLILEMREINLERTQRGQAAWDLQCLSRTRVTSTWGRDR